MKKGFTLIELLVVIGIIAILAVVVVVTINPAELLRQTRDSTRITELGTLKSALTLYLVDATTPVLETNYRRCSMSAITANATSSTVCGWFSANINASSTRADITTARKVDGTGWIPVNFSSISSGSPLGNLPVDPVNSSVYYYAYAPSSTLVFELNAKMESSRYSNTGPGDVESTDGGNQSGVYEVGTAPGFTL